MSITTRANSLSGCTTRFRSLRHSSCLALLVTIALLGSLGAGAQAVDFTQEIVSLTSEGTQAMLGSDEPSMSAFGDYVAFTSAAPAFSGEASALRNVYVRDRISEVTVLISRGKDGPADGPSFQPDMASHATHVVFASQATNLECESCDNNGTFDVYMVDMKSGQPQRISVAQKDEANNASYEPSVSEKGNRVAFTSWATNLVSNDTNDARDVFVWDRYKGIRRVSISPQGAQFTGDSHSPQISVTGEFVVFVTEFGPGVSHVYVHDLHTGKTSPVSELSELTQVGANIEPSISVTGDYIAWVANGYLGIKTTSRPAPYRVFVRQMQSTYQCTPLCTLTHPHTWQLNREAGEQREPQVFGAIILAPLLYQSEGQYGVAYTSIDTHGNRNVVIHNDGAVDEDDDHIVVLSANPYGDPANGDSYHAAVGGDIVNPHWWRVVFVTDATNLQNFDGNDAADVIFVERIE